MVDLREKKESKEVVRIKEVEEPELKLKVRRTRKTVHNTIETISNHIKDETNIQNTLQETINNNSKDETNIQNTL